MLTGFKKFEFERSTPEEVGIDSASIAEFERRIRERGIGHQGYMFYRHGKLAASSIASPYRATDKRHVYSISKSWTSTAIGIAVDEGLIKLDDRLISFFPDELPEKIGGNLAAMTLRHVLSMNTGHETDTVGRVASREPGWSKRFLALDVENVPGTHFAYNSTATYMLSAVITRVTGMRMVDYLKPRLFNPLGISDVWWEESADGVNDGGWGIHVSPEDMLKLGVLYLNRGVWNGMRILSESYIDEATSAVSDNSSNGNIDWKLGYGYQWWRCQHNCYRGDGAFGQYIIVSPEKDSAAVIISEEGDMQSILDIYWDTVFAGMKDQPLPEPTVKYETEVKPFMIPPVYSGESIQPTIYHIDKNFTDISEISLRSVGENLILKLGGGIEKSVEIVCGAGEWEYNHFDNCPMSPTQLFGSLAIGIKADIAAAWGSAGDRLVIRLCFVSTPHGFEFEFRRTEGKLFISKTLDKGAKSLGFTLI